MALDRLPPEILVMILTELDWEHVLRARQTCRTLDSASRSRQVWYNIFQLISSDYDHPLSSAKHVPRMSASELEFAVTRWLRVGTGWMSKTKNPRRRSVAARDQTWFHLSEGGRWLIASSLGHGCVSAYDLDAPEIEKYIIIRPEHKRQCRVTRMAVHVDTVLPHLDLQVALVHESKSHNLSRLSIWRVVCTQHDNRPCFSSTLSSSFNTRLEGTTVHVTLHDDLIAQEVWTAAAATIVIHDWKQSSSFHQHRWCIFPAAQYNALQFLPGRRLLTVHEDCASIYVIPDCHRSSDPTLTFTVSLGARFFRGLSPTYCDYAGNTRVMLGTRHGICQLIIPSREKPSALMLLPVPNNRPHYFAIGTHRALVAIFPKVYQEMQGFTANLCQGTPVCSEVRSWTIGNGADYQPFIDDITGRVVEVSDTYYIVVSDYCI